MQTPKNQNQASQAQAKNRMIVLTTGGTIEKTYSEVEGSLENRKSVLREKIIPRLRLPHTEIDVEEIMAKDSLHMTDQDRQIIFEHVAPLAQLDRPILVIHGTDTMQLSAEYCFQRCQDVKVPVVFTGAMKPVGFEDSDAIQNFTEALIAASILPPGIYISFHSRIFKVPNVRKNLAKSTFEEIG